jgi:hypothetical protein
MFRRSPGLQFVYRAAFAVLLAGGALELAKQPMASAVIFFAIIGFAYAIIVETVERRDR